MRVKTWLLLCAAVALAWLSTGAEAAAQWNRACNDKDPFPVPSITLLSCDDCCSDFMWWSSGQGTHMFLGVDDKYLFSVCSNGQLVLANQADAFSQPLLPLACPDAFVASRPDLKGLSAYMDDLDTTTGGGTHIQSGFAEPFHITEAQTILISAGLVTTFATPPKAYSLIAHAQDAAKQAWRYNFQTLHMYELLGSGGRSWAIFRYGEMGAVQGKTCSETTCRANMWKDGAYVWTGLPGTCGTDNCHKFIEENSNVGVPGTWAFETTTASISDAGIPTLPASCPAHDEACPSLDPCGDFAPCVNGDCTNSGSPGAYTCDCDDGYEGTDCDIDVCDSNPCVNGACVHAPGGYTCDCNDGYGGTHCETDFCASNPCVNGACVRVADGYTCDCNDGWGGTLCDDDLCIPDPCVNGDCNAAAGGYTCTCDAGYTGTNCDSELDECLSSPCAHGSCTDAFNSYTCTCDAGWSGTHCDILISMCLSNPCWHGDCVDLPNAYRCDCDAGYTGTKCETEIDECSSNPCTQGDCIDMLDGYTCACTCVVTPVDQCATLTPCDHGDCVSTQAGGYVCLCDAGYGGTDCDIDLDECSPDPCDHGTCTDGIASFTCACDEGWAGVFCDCQPPACLSAPCQNDAICDEDALLGYTCTCALGWTGPNCDIDARRVFTRCDDADADDGPFCVKFGYCFPEFGGVTTVDCLNYCGCNVKSETKTNWKCKKLKRGNPLKVECENCVDSPVGCSMKFVDAMSCVAMDNGDPLPADFDWERLVSRKDDNKTVFKKVALRIYLHLERF